MFDVIVRWGRVYDGTGNPWTEVDLGIAEGRPLVKFWGKHEEIERIVGAEAPQVGMAQRT